MKALNILFMGTPDFAVASLDSILHKSSHNVLAVVTAPDKRSGRGKKMTSSAVKEYSYKHNLLILQPTNLKSQEFINNVKDLNPDVIVVVAFRMLPKAVWELPKYGTINLHASLLPDYRGAAPINHAIINGESKTGVTTFFINENIDTGKIIKRKEVDILFEENAGDLHDKLMDVGAQLLASTLDDIANDNYTCIDQSQAENELKMAPKIFKEDCKINWNDNAINIYNFIRGLSPYPAAFTYLVDEDGNRIYAKILKAKIIQQNSKERILSDNSNYLYIKTADDFISVEEIQLEGKKKISIKDLLNGFDITKIKSVD